LTSVQFPPPQQEVRQNRIRYRRSQHDLSPPPFGIS
jgi:hypothetical protein